MVVWLKRQIKLSPEVKQTYHRRN